MFFVANNGNIQLNKLLLAQNCSSYYDLWISTDSGVFEIYDIIINNFVYDKEFSDITSKKNKH